MEGGIIEDNGCIFWEFLEEVLGQPLVEPISVGCAIEQNGSKKFCSVLCSNKAGAWARITTSFAIDFCTNFTPAMCSVGIGGKSAFIDIYEAFCPTFLHYMAELTQIGNPSLKVSFCVTKGFFYG